MASMLNIKPNPVNIVGNCKNINFSNDDFKKIREMDTCYIDKSKMIEDILTYDSGRVLLFTRPRRFGKSLNLSMMRYFFDMKEDTRHLFKDLYLEKSPLFEENLNQYPVLYLNFKDSNADTFENVSEGIWDILKRGVELLAAQYHMEELRQLELRHRDGAIWVSRVKYITQALKEKTGKDVVVLVDEYDNLINKAYGSEDFIKICTCIKDIFGALFKSNEYLKLGILTGVSRIGRELSFSDMNNLVVYGLTNSFYYEYYGFTEEEVKALFKMHKQELTPRFYTMYNGYKLDDSQNMFNTTSILKFLDNYIKTGKMDFNAYWVNAATNAILKDNIQRMNSRFKDKLLSMIDGETIYERLVNSIDYESLDKSENVFTLLIDTGYLCPIKQMSGNTYELKIPNEEVLYGYHDMIESIVGAGGQCLGDLCTGLAEGNIEQFQEQFNDVLSTVASFHDFREKENSYHNFMMGALLYLLDSHYVKSNREAGNGRYDIALIPKEVFRKKYRPIIVEFKAVSAREKDKNYKKYTEEELAELAEKALAQIEERNYCGEYSDLYEKEGFIFVGIGAQGKTAVVKSNMEEEF